MKLYPIKLGTGRVLPTKKGTAGAKTGSGKQANPLTKEQKEQIFARDNHTCQCCGFVSEKYQQVLHKDNNLNNHDPDNLITACIFCHQCYDLTQVADMKSGTLVWLPEISQAKLNNMARAIYIARISQGDMATVARDTLDMIMKRREEAKRRISTDDPFILATVLNDYLNLKQYSQRLKKLKGIRLFPLDRRIVKEADLEFNQFPQILAYWRSKKGPFGAHPPAVWTEHYQDMLTWPVKSAAEADAAQDAA